MIIGGKFQKLAGLEKHFIELSKGLAKNLNLTVIAHKSYKNFFTENYINFIELNLSKSRFNIFTYFKLYNIFKKYNFDVIHSQANKATYFTSKLKNFFPKTKFIATIHNKKNKVSFFNKMDLVIGVSDFVCSQISTKTVTIYNGINQNKFKNLKKIDLRNEFDLNNDYPIGLGIGRLVEAKGFDLLINAVENININILLLGDGKEEGELNALIEEKKLSSRVKILGFRDNIEEIIASANFVIISSRNEGFSYVFAETLCLRKPLLSTDVADIKKFIPDNLLIKDKSSHAIEKTVKEFINQSLDLEYYYDNAKKTFSIENMIMETKYEYQKIIES